MSTLDEIRSWVETEDEWIQDAIGRLLEKEILSHQDDEEILQRLKTRYGIPTNMDNLPPIRSVITLESTDDRPHPKVALVSLHNIVNVNALAPSQCLRFIPKGLTIIYGGNGTGKSGYSRILKKACHAGRAL